jgi:glucose-6-phosphate isomerase
MDDLGKRLSLDWTKAHDVVPLEKELNEQSKILCNAKQLLSSKELEFTGWLDHIEGEALDFASAIKEDVKKLLSYSDALVVIGVGGSFLGTQAVHQAMNQSSHHSKKGFLDKPTLFFAGYHLDIKDLSELLEALDGYTPSLVLISKSGSTTEPALAFRVIKKYFDDRFGKEESHLRTTIITDPKKGKLREITESHKYKSYSIPENIGGRYSIFTPAGIFPLAISGIDVESFIKGAKQAKKDCLDPSHNSLDTNLALCYAGVRNILYSQGFKVESLCVWSPKYLGFAEWWKQLFSESDGKNNSGIFPTSALFSRDLHSLGQYFQEGEKFLFSTHITVDDEFSLSKGTVKKSILVPDSDLEDGFSFVSKKDLFSIQKEVEFATIMAHSDGGMPVLTWQFPRIDEWWLGYWMYTNMLACAIGGIARGINPFDQPGVENYKKNMFALLGHPGHVEEAKKIKNRLENSKRLKSVSVSSQI